MNARNASKLTELFDKAPLNAYLGHRLIEASDGTALLALPPRPEFRQEGGRVHGGILTTLADTAAVYALLSTGRWTGGFTSVELKLNFLRPARFDGPDLEGAAEIVQQGRRVAVCDVRIRQDGKELARGLFTYLAEPPTNAAD